MKTTALIAALGLSASPALALPSLDDVLASPSAYEGQPFVYDGVLSFASVVNQPETGSVYWVFSNRDNQLVACLFPEGTQLMLSEGGTVGGVSGVFLYAAKNRPMAFLSGCTLFQ